MTGLLAMLVSCDSGGGGGLISEYCDAYCGWQDECNEWFEDEYGSLGECKSECREHAIQDGAGSACGEEWLAYYSCYYEELRQDCTGFEVTDECSGEADDLQDCAEEHYDDDYYGNDPMQ
jgi:hypothetical protein